MGEDTLGLPLEYKEMPQYFDAHNLGEDTDAKNAVIERLLKQHKVKTVLDPTCGTGSQVFFLAKRGYKVTGADFSPALLAIAREKARKEKLDVRFIDGDMRTLKAGQYDAVITIFNAIGHLTKTDFEKALRNIHGNLKEGGLYVFDIFNLDAMTDSAVDALAMDFTKTVNGTTIRNVQHSTIDRENGRLTSYDSYTIQEDGDVPRKLRNQFTLQIYTAEELKEILTGNGFGIMGHYGMDGAEFVEHKTPNILTVAKRQ